MPDVRTAEDPARDDLEIRVWSEGNAFGHEVSSQDRLAAILILLDGQCSSGYLVALRDTSRWRSVGRSSFTQTAKIPPSVIVSMSMAWICTITYRLTTPSLSGRPIPESVHTLRAGHSHPLTGKP